MIRQLAFDLPARDQFRRGDFFVSPANATALAALAAPMATAVLGLTATACGRRGPIPHGPSMLAATVGAAALAMF